MIWFYVMLAVIAIASALSYVKKKELESNQWLTCLEVRTNMNSINKELEKWKPGVPKNALLLIGVNIGSVGEQARGDLLGIGKRRVRCSVGQPARIAPGCPG